MSRSKRILAIIQTMLNFISIAAYVFVFYDSLGLNNVVMVKFCITVLSPNSVFQKSLYQASTGIFCEQSFCSDRLSHYFLNLEIPHFS